MRRLVVLLGLLLGLSGASAFAQDAVESALWGAVRYSNRADQVEVYLRAYPNGAYAAQARSRLATLRGGRAAPPVAPTPAATGGAFRLDPDHPLYAPFEPIVVHWSGARPPRLTGQIQIRVPGEENPLESFSIAPAYANPKPVANFQGRVPGSYEVVFRSYNTTSASWEPLSQITVTVAKDAATAGGGTPRPGTQPLLNTDRLIYAPMEPIVIHWTDVRSRQGRIIVRRAGTDQPVEQFTPMLYNAPKGQQRINGKVPGDYEVTLEVPGDPHGYSYNETLVYGRTVFTIAAGATASAPATPGTTARQGTTARIDPEHPAYAPFVPVIVSYADIRNKASTRISVREAGSDTIIEQRIFSTYNSPSARVQLYGRLPGRYDVAIEAAGENGYFDRPFVMAKTSFTVDLHAPGGSPDNFPRHETWDGAVEVSPVWLTAEFSRDQNAIERALRQRVIDITGKLETRARWEGGTLLGMVGTAPGYGSVEFSCRVVDDSVMRVLADNLHIGDRARFAGIVMHVRPTKFDLENCYVLTGEPDPEGTRAFLVQEAKTYVDRANMEAQK